ETYPETQDDEHDSQAVASIVQRDPALVAELLRLANSNYYNRSGQRIANLGEAVSLLGFRRVGDLAIAFSALGVLSGSVLPWLDVNLTWQRSIAASMAAELLARQAGYDMQGNGVSLCALMHPLGRILLGSLFPREYEVMTKTCIQQNESLQELERQVFPLTHTAAGAHLLSAWGLPPEVHHPLHHVADTFNVLGQLAEPTRTKVELIKLAILVGRLAVGRWNARDRIDLPSVSLLNKLRVVSLIDIVQRVRQDMTTLAANQSLVTCSREESESKRMNTALRYCRLSDGSDHAIDPALLLISSMDFRVEELLGDARVEQHGVMINCLGVPSDRISALVPQPPDSRSVLLVDRPLPDSLKGHGNLLRLPCSYGRLLTACQELAPAELAGPHSRVK
ncbi:MAG: HDOD domain-containing protein, partial [Pirellulaceae bacterium]